LGAALAVAVMAAPGTGSAPGPGSTPGAGSEECRRAATDFDETVADVREAVRTYEKCVSASHGRNNCSAEIQALDDSHDDFEDAVASYTAACH
jgi:hypothetical protein